MCRGWRVREDDGQERSEWRIGALRESENPKIGGERRDSMG